MFEISRRSISQTKRIAYNKDLKEMQEWHRQSKKEEKFRTRIREEYTQQRSLILAEKLKALENKGG